jgi:UDP-2,3-diacylglucosamine pyrophosphatase LpxH
MNPESLHDLLIVSDLHLSEGRPLEIKKFSKNEDFFFDEEFAGFLAYYQDQTRWPGKKWHLIINGDFLDFLQVTSQEDAPPSLHRDPDHPEYGLACGEQETVYKLKKIMEGHWQFFEALAEFVGSGNVITITKGNHDVEFHYAAVQEELVNQLREIFKNKFIPTGDPNWAQRAGIISSDSVRFADWFYYEKDLLWIEHGNQYDKENSFKYWLSPLLPAIPDWPQDRQDEIDLPWGSLFVRYLFNKIEKTEPFADNIKPQTEFVRWLLLTHPIMAVRFLFGDGRYMLKKMRRAWRRLPKGAYAQRMEEHGQRLQAQAHDSGIGEEKLQCLDQKHAAPVLTEPSGMMWKAFRWAVRCRLVLLAAGVFVALVIAASALAVSPALRALVPSTVQNFTWKLLAATPIGPWLMWALPAIRWAILLIAVAAIIWYLVCLFTRKKTKKLSYLAARAGKICQCLNVKYVLMGHTHDADFQSIGEKGQEYFNTGTWTKVFSEEERLIRKDVQFVFVQALRRDDGLQVKLQEWDDAAYEPRLLKLFRESSPTAKSNGR